MLKNTKFFFKKAKKSRKIVENSEKNWQKRNEVQKVAAIHEKNVKNIWLNLKYEKKNFQTRKKIDKNV